MYAGLSVITGTHWRSHASTATSPPGLPSMHGLSWPSLQRFGLITLKFGVVAMLARSSGIRVSGTSFWSHTEIASMIEWK